MSGPSIEDLPQNITSLWYIGRQDENAKNYIDLAHNERCRLAASLIEGTDRYKLTLIEASYNKEAPLEDMKRNLKGMDIERFVRDHFSLASILTNTNECVESLELEARGYTIEATELNGEFSLKDVEQAMIAFRDGRAAARTGPLSWCNHVEDGAKNNTETFGVSGQFSSVSELPPEKIKASHFNWPQISEALRNPMMTWSDPAKHSSVPSGHNTDQSPGESTIVRAMDRLR